ncbi:dienelactone hydrolase family protein [Ensifer sp. ENS04]|uniref:alpha/beta hydrolase family protein n=1 Tax=Ensifer sp. ENS04 TaxID=2769281 RepID=UPI001784D744|nr:dienelactone hydrolase family protein [Ensifer sp. ENS04]MBD9541100.1 dienelactone hydrolase family protein [Ensifer sp. ENS04]
MFFRLLASLCLVLLWSANASAGVIEGVGAKKLEVVDPVEQKPMDAVVFFPSPDQTDVSSIGPYEVDVSRSAPIGDDRYPLIMLSHGSMGSMWGHHDLASSLARQGYMVVSVTHVGDNFQDTSRISTAGAIYGRAMQISAALTATLDDPVLALHIDRERIGFVGFSAGGTTGLILAGAKPDLSRLVGYCAKRPDDRHVCEARGRIGVEGAELGASADARIRSFVLLAPLSVLFPTERLKSVAAPISVYVGEKDEELSPDDNALALARDMQSEIRVEVVPNAGHFTFLAPCSPQMRDAVPAICADPPGVDRVELHRTINAEIAAFFTRTLAVAVP